MPPRPARLARAPDVSPPAGTGLLPPPCTRVGGVRAGHMTSPLQLDHILNRPGIKRENRAKGSHPSNAGFGPGAGLGGRELQ